MKRKLAKEALYSSEKDFQQTDAYREAMLETTPTVEEVAERIKQVDPDGKKALALLNEIEQLE